MIFDFSDFWADIKENWHKYGVILLILIHLWKFFFDYIRPVVKKEPESMVIKIPKEGCVITVKPLGEASQAPDKE